MKITLKGIGDHVGETGRPEFDARNCSVRISVDIGLDDEEGADYFHVQVVTPAYLASCQKPMWGKSLLVVQAFSWDEIERVINGLVSGICPDTWEDAVKLLTRYMDWQYEGMKGSDGKILVPYTDLNCGNQ